jgi:hypothetical protein
LGVGKKGIEHAHMWNMQGEMRDKELAKWELENKQTTMLVHYKISTIRMRERERENQTKSGLRKWYWEIKSHTKCDQDSILHRLVVFDWHPTISKLTKLHILKHAHKWLYETLRLKLLTRRN